MAQPELDYSNLLNSQKPKIPPYSVEHNSFYVPRKHKPTISVIDAIYAVTHPEFAERRERIGKQKGDNEGR